MKFKTPSSDILGKIRLASSVLANNPIMPILEDVLMELKGNTLTITASDLETTIKTTLDVLGEQDGSIAVRGKILTETIKSLPSQPIEFEKQDKDLVIRSNNGVYKLAIDSNEDYPVSPLAKYELDLPVNIVQYAIDNTLFATSSDEMRQAMTGVYVGFKKDSIDFAATDAHKLVRYTYTDFKSDTQHDLIIPKKSIGVIKNALTKNNDINIGYDNSHVHIGLEDTTISCRLIDARFPNYNAVIPISNDKILNIDRQSLLNSLKRIYIYTNKTTNQVIFNLSKDKLEVVANDLDHGSEAMEVLNCSYSSDDLTIGFNSKYLIEMISVVKSDMVTMEFSEPSRPAIILPNNDKELTMLIMPVVLNI